MNKMLTFFLILSLGWLAASCSSTDADPIPLPRHTTYSLDANSKGVIETRNNILNMTVVSRDENDLRAEYRAGFVQGKLQGRTIWSARDNTWDHAYLLDPSHSFPRQHGPSQGELDEAADMLLANYEAFLDYVNHPATDPVVGHRLKRLLFRMLGIYHGATRAAPDTLDYSGDWLPDTPYFEAWELVMGYETSHLTFMDIYFLNAFCDVMDAISFSPERAPGGIRPGDHPDKCSAFLKRSGDEIILTHNTWQGFLSQTMTQTLVVNDDATTMNSVNPGLIGSLTDFGFNNKGILFNETTHRVSRSVVNPTGLWIFWRAALAEQFSASIDEFFQAMSLDNTGTYLNGYMIADINTGETGLVEMSYRCFVFYRSDGGPYTVTSLSMDSDPCTTNYDPEMVTPEYLMGINFPASLQVREDLQSTDNRPARRLQLLDLLPGVTDVDTAKEVITYTDPDNPLSIFGRWDVGYGQTPYPKQIPDGSIDSKVATSQMVRDFMALDGVLDLQSRQTGFWMLYGTPHVQGEPFIWSRSSWSWQPRRDVPDRLDGRFTLMPLYLR